MLRMRVTSIASGPAERRQDRGDALGEHRLAGSRRPAEQAVVPARRCDHQRAHGVMLTAHFAQVRAGALASPRTTRPGGRRGQRIGAPPREHAHGAAQPLDGRDLEVLDQPRLARTQAGEHERAEVPPGAWPGRPRAFRDRPRRSPSSASSPNSTWPSSCSRGICPLAASSAQASARSSAAPAFGTSPGREAGGDAPGGKLEARVEDRRAHAFARLPHGRVGEPDDRERGQSRAHVDLDGHMPWREPLDRERVCPRQHPPRAPPCRRLSETSKLGGAWDETLGGRRRSTT